MKILLILLFFTRGSFAISTLEEIQKEEGRLDQAIQTYRKNGINEHAYRDLNLRLKKILDNEQLETFYKEGIDSVPISQKSEVLEIVSKMEKIHLAFIELQAHADQFMLSQLDYLLINSKRVLQESVSSLKGEIDDEAYAKLVKHLEKVEGLAVEYEESKVRFGTGKDVIRRSLFLKYFTNARLLVKDLQKSIDSPTRNYSNLQKLSFSFRKTRHQIKIFLRLIVPAVRTLFAYYFPGKDAFSNLPKKALGTIKKLADATNITVKVEGKEHIPKKSGDRKLVTIYTPTHRHPINDLVIMERIQNSIDETAITYAATRNFAPPKIADKLAEHPAVIPVGSAYGNPTERLLKTLAENETRSVFLYPEAGIHSGVQNTLPIRDELSTKLFQALRKAGYKLQIVPITHLDAARTLDKSIIFDPANKGYELNVKIHETIKSDLVELLYRVDETAITRFMRAIMLENLVTDENRILGMLRPHVSTTELLKYTAKDCSAALTFMLGRGIKLTH